MTLRALFPVTQQFQNKNGSNLVGGKVYIYYQGRTALATTYHDEAGTVVNPNPVLLDNNGRAAVFADTIYSYTIVVCDYYGKELFSQDITLHDAISTAEKVMVMGSNGSVKVDTTTLPNGEQYDLSVNTDIIATKKSVDDVKTDLNTLTGTVNNHTTQIGQIQEDINGIESTVVNKKDKQAELNFNGSATKTVKSITQNANGELNVEFTNIAGGGGGGTTYTAGDAIDITDNAISVKYSKGLELNIDNQLEVKSGKGLTFDNNNNLKVSVGEGIYLDSNGKLTTELPDDWIDITNEWVFINNFRLQYNGEFPGFGNEMTVWYSKIRKLVKFTGSMRVNKSSSFSDSEWHVFMQYIGNRFYDSYNAPNVSLAPKIYPTQIGGITSVPATSSSGRTLNALMKLSYIGAPTTTPEYCGLGMQLFIPSNMTVNGAIMEGIQLSVTPIE